MVLLHKQTNHPSKGQFLVELLVTIALAAIVLPGLFITFVTSREGKAQQDQRLKAMGFLKEAQEAARIVRQRGWDNFAVNGTFHPATSSATWSFVPGTEQINGFNRNIVVSDVNRSASGAAVETEGTIDPSTKKLTFSVWWTTPRLATVSAQTFLTRYLGNTTFVQASQSDFNAGTKSSVSVTSTGEVTLGSGGIANWCLPQNALVSVLTLPKNGNTIVATQSAAFVGTGDGTDGVTFAKIDITDPAPPATPSATIASTYTSSYKTNAVFNDGSYVYLATDGSSSQVNILDTSSIPYQRIGWIDVPGGKPANGIYVYNNIAYVTSDNNLYTFNVINKTGAHTTVLGQTSMWFSIGTNPLAKQVVVRGQYVFVGTANTLFGLQKFKIANNGASLNIVGVSNLTWKQAAQGLAVNTDGTRAYIAFNNGAGFFPKGFFIVDTTQVDPPSWWPFPAFYPIVGTYNTGSTDPRGMVVVPTNKAIVVGIGGSQQYQVIDISNEASPVSCGGMTVTSGVVGIASVQENDGDSYSYIITGEANNQFKVIQGGPGGGQYATSGTFTSSVFDASPSAAFNSFYATVSQPANTNITFQVAATNAVANSCASVAFDFLGPDGTGNTYFATSSAAIPVKTLGNYANPGRCFKYKAYLSTTNQNATPTLYDMTVNYSP